MSTAIGWTHRPGTTGESWNPVTGCTEISPGCAYCYARRITERSGGPTSTSGGRELDGRTWDEFPH